MNLRTWRRYAGESTSTAAHSQLQKKRLHELAGILDNSPIIGYWIEELAIDGGGNQSAAVADMMYTLVDFLKG